MDRCKDPKSYALVENRCSIRHNKMADQIIWLTHLPAMAVISVENITLIFTFRLHPQNVI